jgi:hypothetical protein
LLTYGKRSESARAEKQFDELDEAEKTRWRAPAARVIEMIKQKRLKLAD